MSCGSGITIQLSLVFAFSFFLRWREMFVDCYLRDFLICSVQWQEYGQQEAVSSYSKQSFVKAWCQGLTPHWIPHLLHPGSSLSVSSRIFLSCPRIQRCRLAGLLHLLYIPALPQGLLSTCGQHCPGIRAEVLQENVKDYLTISVILVIASWHVSLAIQVYASQSVEITCK